MSDNNNIFICCIPSELCTHFMIMFCHIGTVNKTTVYNLFLNPCIPPIHITFIRIINKMKKMINVKRCQQE